VSGPTTRSIGDWVALETPIRKAARREKMANPIKNRNKVVNILEEIMVPTS